jgi:curved DNA-binding protein CbpA
MDSKDHYKVLGLLYGAGADSIRKAYYEKAKKFHPDLSGEGTAVMQRINDAYAVLSDPLLREQYDRALLQQLPASALHNFAVYNAASCAPGFSPEGICGEGWQGAGKGPWTMEILFREAVMLERISVEAIALPYHIKRNALNSVELHHLYAVDGESIRNIAEFRLDCAGDRDIDWAFPGPAGPLRVLHFTTIRAVAPPAWKNLRMYGFLVS